MVLDSLKARLLFMKRPIIIVLNDVIVFIEMHFLLTNRTENCIEIVPTKYEKRCHTFF